MSHRILLECGNTLISGNNSGIQRVSRNLAREAQNLGPEFGLNILPVLNHRSRCVDGTQWLTKLDNPQPSHRPRKIQKDPLVAFSAENQLLQKLQTLLQPHLLIPRLRHEITVACTPSVRTGPGDTVVLLDCWWQTDLGRLLHQARLRGARTGLVIYDILPITHAQFFPESFPPTFQHHLEHYLNTADFFLVISQTVKNELTKFAETVLGQEVAASLKIEVFPLGSTLDLTQSDHTVTPEVRQIFTPEVGSPPYLMVGTLEPRKNHDYLLDAFERVWQECPDTRLCFLGRNGWMSQALLDRIHHHPRLGRQLYLLNNASDADLEFSYQHARALVYPSHAEGYGLPLIEGLRHRLSVLASDTLVHRETGREHCTYFDLANPGSLAKLLVDAERSGKLPHARPWDPRELLDWRSAAREFVRKCLESALAVSATSR